MGHVSNVIIRTVPVWGSHWSPPLQPPSRQAVGPPFEVKLQPRRPYNKGNPALVSQEDAGRLGQLRARRKMRTQIRPDFQLSGTEN